MVTGWRVTVRAGLAACLLAGAHCGGTTTTGTDAGVGEAGGGLDGGSDSPAAGGMCPARLDAPPVGRPVAKACAATNPGLFGMPDGGATTCTVDTDCTPPFHCLGNRCGPDQCLTDGDCPNGTACGCSDAFRGNAMHTNLCISATCRVDADCGPSGVGVCSGMTGGACGGLSGFICRSAADTCHADADCCSAAPSCQYQPTLGHWACQAISVCNG
jgi:hypothetical protein